MAFLLGGKETRELKERMRKIIEVEQESVKAIKADIASRQKLIDALNAHRIVLEKILGKM